VFLVFLRLGCTSFGGPVAHIGFFRDEFVDRRKWLTEDEFSSTLALCQFLPGPASSQFGLSVGMMRAGFPGALAAWIAFTTPSAILMIAFALGMLKFAPEGDPGWLQGLRIAVVVVVIKAVWGMARSLCPDRERLTLAFAAAIAILTLQTAWSQVAVIIAGGLVGWVLYRDKIDVLPAAPAIESKTRHFSLVWVVLFFGLLLLPPLFASEWLNAAHGFYRSGSLVFGGGHVVLPLLRDSVVPPGWMTDETFMAGYGAAQAVPGPLFTISAYLGTISSGPLSGIGGGIIALVAIFLPSFLLIFGALPHWQKLSQNQQAAAALQGANAAVVGLLLAALYQPVWLSGILSTTHAIIGLGLFALVIFWKLPPWGAVLVAALAGHLLL